MVSSYLLSGFCALSIIFQTGGFGTRPKQELIMLHIFFPFYPFFLFSFLVISAEVWRSRAVLFMSSNNNGDEYSSGL